MAGRLNPLATAYIPGDTDRDGDCDQEDIDKLAAVFGNDDWIFSNSFQDAPEGDEGDPAEQTRPWDVDGTGDNGIECSDLQWVLNFQGNTTGQIAGLTYDSETPSSAGVVLNPNTAVVCSVASSATAPSGHALTSLVAGEAIDLTVSAMVTGGGNTAAGQQNGVMQFVHDLTIDTAGVAEVVWITPAAPFATTNSDAEINNADAGMQVINGYTTSFTTGLTASADLYTVRLRAIGAGSATLNMSASADAKFVASTPFGLKVGHTDNNGDPATATYPGGISISVSGVLATGDLNCSGNVGFDDINPFVSALVGGQAQYEIEYPGCNFYNGDINGDGVVGFGDINPFVDLLVP